MLFETVSLTRYIVASGILFGLLGALYFALLLYKRRTTTGSFQPQKRRLTIQETLPLSARHKLLIIKQDDLEHTLLIGGNTDVHLGSAPAQKNTPQEKMTTKTDSVGTIGFLKNLKK